MPADDADPWTHGDDTDGLGLAIRRIELRTTDQLIMMTTTALLMLKLLTIVVVPALPLLLLLLRTYARIRLGETFACVEK